MTLGQGSLSNYFLCGSDFLNLLLLIKVAVFDLIAVSLSVLRKIMMISLKKSLGTKSYFCVNSSLYHFRLYQILTISFQIVSTPYYIISDCIGSEILIGDDILFRADVF